MAGFKFRLETVLNLARRVQDQKAQVMAEAQAAFQAEEAKLHAIVRQQEASRQGILDAQLAADLQSIQWGLDFLARLVSDEANQRLAISGAANRVEAARAELMAAAQKVQVLEKLKEKAKADHQKRLDHAEAVFIDELATIRFARRTP